MLPGPVTRKFIPVNLSIIRGSQASNSETNITFIVNNRHVEVILVAVETVVNISINYHWQQLNHIYLQKNIIQALMWGQAKPTPHPHPKLRHFS